MKRFTVYYYDIYDPLVHADIRRFLHTDQYDVIHIHFIQGIKGENDFKQHYVGHPHFGRFVIK